MYSNKQINLLRCIERRLKVSGGRKNGTADSMLDQTSGMALAGPAAPATMAFL